MKKISFLMHIYSPFKELQTAQERMEMTQLEVIRALAARLPPEVPRRGLEGPGEERIRERSLFRVVSPHGQRSPEMSNGDIGP
jgi:hypothetical protein